MKKQNLVPLVASTLFTLCSYADESKENYQQETTIVTASRYQQSKDDIIPSISIIEREDILNLQALNILDILSLQQGIDVARTGGNGSQTSVFVRGTNSNHTLILIDGVRAASSFTGSFAWENLPVSQIERIEIVRGSRVSYYGSDAIGGVINIITRKQDKLYARYTTGSYETHSFDAGFGGSTENNQYSIVLGHQQTDGFSATNENNLFGFNPDNDGYENQNLTISASHQFVDSKLSLNYFNTKADIDFDSFLNRGNSMTSERIIKLSWNGQLFNAWDSEVAISNNNNTNVTKVFSNDFNSDRLNFDLLLNKSIKNNHIGLGLSYRNENSEYNHSVVNQLNYNDSRNNRAIFASWQSDINKNIISLSGRYDNNSVYGNNFSTDAGWAYQITNTIRVNLSAGSAFHAPSLDELFSPVFNSIVFSPDAGQFINFFSIEGNSELKPEESTNYELGLKFNLADNHRLAINAFYYEIDNLIDFQGHTFKPFNVNEATIKGIEVAYNYRYNNLNFNANGTFQDANNDQSNTPLLRRPDNKVNLSIDKFFQQFSFGSSIRYASENPDFGVDLEGYTVIDLRAAYKINSHWKISAKLENIADEEYQIINGYNTAGASGYLTIEWQQ